MDFNLTDEQRMLKDLVEKFVRAEILPLEGAVMAREANGEGSHLSPAEKAHLDKVSKDLGLWSLDAPEEVGGLGFGYTALVGVNEWLGYSAAHYTLPPDSPNLRMLATTVNEKQRAA